MKKYLWFIEIIDMIDNFLTGKYTSKLVNIFVLLFSISVLSFDGHGGQVCIAMILTAMYVKVSKPEIAINLSLNLDEKIFIFAISIFILVQLLGVFFQPQGFEYESLYKKLRAFDFPSRWLLMLPVLYLLRRYLINWKLLTIGLGTGAIIAVCIAHYQLYFLGIQRPTSIFHDSIPFGELMVVVDVILWMFVSYAYYNNNRLLSIYLLIASLIAFYGSLLAVTRGAWLVYVFLLFVWIVWFITRSLFNFSVTLIKPMLLRILLSILVFFAVSQTEQYNELKYKSERVVNNLSQGNFEGALEGRYEAGQTSLRIIKDYPFGVGTDNFISANKEYRIRPAGARPEYRAHAHNELLNLWVENGIQGVLSLMLIIGISLKSFFFNLKNENSLVSAYSGCGILLIVSYFKINVLFLIFLKKFMS